MSNIYFKEVINSHILIERILAENKGDIELFLSAFDPEFTMITMTGKKLNKSLLTQFFNSQKGTRPGLSIKIKDMKIIESIPNGAIVSYTEEQSISDSQKNYRYSTVLFRKENNNQIKWLYLQETEFTK